MNGTKLTFSESVEHVREKLAPLEEQRENIWKCVDFMMNNPEMRKNLDVHLFHGELVIPEEKTVVTLVNAVRDAFVNSKMVKGDGDRLNKIKGAQIPLKEIKVLPVMGAVHIEFVFTDFGKTHQGTIFTCVIENDSVNAEKSWCNKFFYSGESSGY